MSLSTNLILKLYSSGLC